VRKNACILAAAVTLAGCAPEPVRYYTYDVVHTFPHDPNAYTQGLFYKDGFLYEGTGVEEQSSIRKVKLETGEVLQRYNIPGQYFGEGIVNWKDRLIQITWTTHAGFIYDLTTFAFKREFSYPGEGWGLTQDGKRIIMSDGTAQLRFWDPETLGETGRITVTDDGTPVPKLNELEWIKGEIYANVWQTDRIARIDPASGKVTAWIELPNLLPPSDRANMAAGLAENVLNGVAYDAGGDRLFVTGKRWPKLFQIRLKERSGTQ
jgi:glutaminyl-peptide cyclotransferase